MNINTGSKSGFAIRAEDALRYHLVRGSIWRGALYSDTIGRFATLTEAEAARTAWQAKNPGESLSILTW